MLKILVRRAQLGQLVVLFGCLLGLRQPGAAQIERPVTWTFAAGPAAKNGEATLMATARISGNYHIYSQFIEAGGPEPTSFTFAPAADYELVDKVTESPAPVKAFDKTFNMNIAYFEKQVVFSQKVRLKAPRATVKGTVTFMVCNDEKCLPPTDVEFSVEVKGTPAKATTTASPTANKPRAAAGKSGAAARPPVSPAAPDTVPFRPEAGAAPVLTSTAPAAPASEQPVAPAAAGVAAPAPAAQQTLWAIFGAGFLGGLLALLMPCIFPLLPLTVSFFTKNNQARRGAALGRAVVYGLSIIGIYVGLGLLITVLFGAGALNELATNGVLNLLFFGMLVAFGASFLGAFELTLPSAWIARADAGADRGGLAGLFFMAATLALVSFSCTGPLIGTLLVQASVSGALLGPAVGMLGFSLALALPFSVFALFPTLLSALPKSGGWLNSVKVVLGFLELALALKFLSTVDLAYHWDWFDRELMLALWIVLFGLLGLYLLGKIRFAHDSEVSHLSVPRLGLAVLTLAFVVYLLPGMWGAPLKALSGLLPPQQTQDFDLYTPTLAGPVAPPTLTPSAAPAAARKYADRFTAPLGLPAFFDYEEARAYAQQAGKPLLIDFTGHGCANCRKMEADVWADRAVLPRLRQDVVLVQLYVDDKTELPTAEQGVSKLDGRKLRTIGHRWADFQAVRYGVNSQPFYVLLDPTTERVLTPPQGANYDPTHFVQFLTSGQAAYQKM